MKKIGMFFIVIALIIAMLPIGDNRVTYAEEKPKNKALIEENSSINNPFKDIDKHWAKDKILAAYEKGLVQGKGNGYFKPDAVVKADEFIVMMLRAFAVEENGRMVFDPAWMEAFRKFQPGFYDELEVAVQKNKFEFQSAKTGYWAKPYVDFLYQMPYLLEFDSVFPKEDKRFEKQLKREEASYLLGAWYSRFEGSFDNNYEDFASRKVTLKDFNTFTPIVGLYRTTVLLAGLMNGYPNNYFYPHRYVTRAEALTMVLRLQDKSLRQPFKPDLKGQYYTEHDEYIALYSDKFKFDTYKQMVALGNKHLKTGHLELNRGYSMHVFASKDDADSWDYLTRKGLYHLRPNIELGVAVDYGTSKIVNVMYPTDKKMPNSKAYFDAILELFAGKGKGQELYKEMQKYEKDLTSYKTTFTWNKKKFGIYQNGAQHIVLEMYY